MGDSDTARDQTLSEEPTLTELVGALQGSEISLGRQVSLFGKSAQNPQDLCYATFRKPTACAVKVQASQDVVIKTQEMTYGATFRRAFKLAAGPARTMRLFGRSVLVTCYSFGNVAEATPATVNCALSTEQPDALSELMPIWFPHAWAAVAGFFAYFTGIAYPNGGYLLRGEGELKALATGDAGPYYLMFFDNDGSVGPAPGDSPLYTIGPIVAGTEFSFDHTVRPDLAFSKGLCAAFSTTLDVYTAVATGGGLLARVDVGGGF